MPSTYLSNTSVTPTNAKKYTFSFWVKRSKILVGAAAQRVINVYTDSNNKLQVAFGTDDRLSIFDKESGATRFSVTPSMMFRDPNGWYHIVIAADTTQSTSSDRMKIYVNGELQTALESSPTYAGQDTNTGAQLTGSGARRIGANESAANHFDGLLSHFHFIDGTQYAASDFGSTDSTTGEWKINTSPSVTYGNNGYFILKDGNSVTDQSGNSNNWTVAAGTLTNTEDCPSNVFATINRLNPNAGENISFSAGNTSIDSAGGAHRNAPATIYLPLGNGKFYWEMKVDRMSTHIKVGLVYDEWSKLNKPTPGEEFSGSNEGYAYRNDGQKENNGLTSYGNSYTVGDIIGIAFDTENSNLYFAKNGTWQNSGDPTSGSTGTGKAFTVASGYVYAPIVNLYDADVSFNFGNGFFGTTAISSEGTNASGIGKFEYDVPAGYTALSTKGLNE